jgi:tRNA pseudouridine32 synthase/23S rRNA pseudouridine746 synthase
MSTAPFSPEILFRDANFAVINKPAGLAVHAGPRGGPSVEDCFPSLSRRRTGPWLAHRLDADTAGCLVIALKRAALLAAQAEFAAGRAEKIYWAVVAGTPATASGTIAAPLRKQTDKTGWRMVIDQNGQPAVTDWRVMERTGDKTWLELRPRTGRTHQIRVHCASIGCPIVGDPVYGGGTGPLHLLARAITLRLSPELCVEAPLPAHMRHGGSPSAQQKP